MTGVSNTPLLVANDLSVRFGGVLAVNKVSFEVQRGEEIGRASCRERVLRRV